MRISVVVLVWNGGRFIDACLSALLQQDVPAEIIVVDNASTDQSVACVEKYTSRVRLIRNDYNFGYAEGNNIGIQVADGEIIVLLNQDTMVQPGWLRAIAETFIDPSIGIVGCKILQPDGRTLLHAGAGVRAGNAETFHIGQGEIDQGQYELVSDSDYVTGAAVAIHRRVLEKIGSLDSQFHPAFYEEIDYCYRARRAGFRVVYQPQAVVYHHETTSLAPASYAHRCAIHRNRVRFVLRHWTSEELETFATVEHQAIDANLFPEDVQARARAYWDNLLAVPLIAWQRGNDDTLGAPLGEGRVRWLIETLQTLREYARRRVFALIVASEQPSLLRPFDELEHDRSFEIALEKLQASLSRLDEIDLLGETQFKSNVPVFGPLIARGRELFLRYSGVRQYVHTALAQQTAINAEARQTTLLLAKQNAALLRLQEIASADDAAILPAWETLLNRLMQLNADASEEKSRLELNDDRS